MVTEFDELKRLLKSEDWPKAISDSQICDENSEADKTERAEGVIDFIIDGSLKDKKFLDFGCGEGHMAKYASSQALFSAGYDIQNSRNFVWETKQENFLLSICLETIKNGGPYDIILMYDVLDHSQDPVQVLKDAKSLLANNGRIYLRCHPWCGRHGGHLYQQINKAFVHLVFNESELLEMGINSDKSIKNKVIKNKVIYPIATYDKNIADAGLIKVSMKIDEQNPEGFFSKNSLVASRIKMALPEKGGTKKREVFPNFQLKQSFLDFVLKR